MYYLKTRKQVNPENLRDPNNVPVLFFYSGPRTRTQALEDTERAFHAKYPTPREQESDEAKSEMESILGHKLQELDHEKEILTKEQSNLLKKQNDIDIREKKGDFQLESDKKLFVQQQKFVDYLNKKYLNMLKEYEEQHENFCDMH